MPSEELQARIDAEAVLLAAILIDGSDGGHLVIDYCRTRLQSANLLKEHQYIYQAMLRAQNPDHVTVALELKRMGKLEAGILAYLAHIITLCPSYLLYKQYIDVVKSYNPSSPRLRGGIPID